MARTAMRSCLHGSRTPCDPAAALTRRRTPAAPTAPRRWPQPREQLRIGIALGIDQRIGVLAARTVQQLGDVEPGGGERGGDLPTILGMLLLAIARRDRARLARQRRFGEVDAVTDVAVLEKIAQRVGGHDRAVLLGLTGRSTQMRQRDGARMRLQRAARKVADVGVQLPAVERRRSRRSHQRSRRAQNSSRAAGGHHAPDARVLIRPRVLSSSGTCRLIISERAHRSSSDSACCTGRTAARLAAR